MPSLRRTKDQAATLRTINAPDPGDGMATNEAAVNARADTGTAVYAITGGKGGVGKTALTANLAYNLALHGKRVLILDADLGLANIDVMFGLAPAYNLAHFFAAEQNLADILADGPLGIKILPAGSGIQQITRLDSQQKIRLLDALDSLQMEFDFLLIDTEAGISENVTYFNTAAQEIIVMTTPDPTAITDAYALMKLLSTQYHEKHFNLVVNQVSKDSDALMVFKKLTMVASRYLDVSLDYLGSIPHDRQLIETIRRQRVVSELYPHAKSAIAFANLAARLCLEPVNPEPKGGLQFFWKKLLRRGTGG